jgi:hypothetical protein
MDASPDSVAQVAVAVHSSIESVLGVMIPIIAIVMGIGMGIVGMWLDYRKKREFFELHHKERMAAIEKGIEVPPLAPELFQGSKRAGRLPSDYLRRGLVWSFIGLGITVAMRLENESGAWYGLIPLAVGVANMLMFMYQRRQPLPSVPDPTLR